MFKEKEDAVLNELPGIDIMNKIYNVLEGKPVWEQQSAKDVIDYTFTYGDTTSSANYNIPQEFQQIPNVSPSCQDEAALSAIYYSTSTLTLSAQAFSVSAGDNRKVNLELGFDDDGVSAKASTAIKLGMIRKSIRSESCHFCDFAHFLFI